MAIKIALPKPGEVARAVALEFKERVERRTPRSNLDKEHAQDKWEIEGAEDNFTVFNDVDYIVHLEYGTSKMEGFHMVALTAEELPDIIQQAVEAAFKKE